MWHEKKEHLPFRAWRHTSRIPKRWIVNICRSTFEIQLHSSWFNRWLPMALLTWEHNVIECELWIINYENVMHFVKNDLQNLFWSVSELRASFNFLSLLFLRLHISQSVRMRWYNIFTGLIFVAFNLFCTLSSQCRCWSQIFSLDCVEWFVLVFNNKSILEPWSCSLLHIGIKVLQPVHGSIELTVHKQWNLMFKTFDVMLCDWMLESCLLLIPDIDLHISIWSSWRVKKGIA